MNRTYHPSADAEGVKNNGRGRRDHFLSSNMRIANGRMVRRTPDGHRRSSRSADQRPPLTRSLGSSMRVRRVNVVDTSSVYLFNVTPTILHTNVTLTVVNLALIIAGIIVLARNRGDEDVCDATFNSRWQRWALGLVVRKMLIAPAHHGERAVVKTRT